MPTSRRTFLRHTAALGTITALSPMLNPVFAQSAPAHPRPLPKLPFHVAVINDEVSQDFDHACHVIAVDFGLDTIEVRGMWGKNIADLSDDEIARAVKILQKYKLRVSDLASPLFKTDFPGGPTVPGLHVDEFGARFNYARQPELLEHCIHLARSFSTRQIRCFDFTRLANPAPARPAIHEELRKASTRLAKDNLVLLLENEHTCNTATGPEAAATLAAVQNTNFMLNWDPANAAAAGGHPFPHGYSLLPKNRIGHCHCKDVKHGPDGKPEWAAVGTGVIDWPGQIRALIQQGFHYTLSLETHWRGAGTPEASTRISFAGLRHAIDEAVA
jgi:sugar phosphate isomerase/epimerase